jgi:hypothetical protein
MRLKTAGSYAQDARMIESPRDWPLWPLLPMKRRSQLGVMVALKPFRYHVFKAGLWELPRTLSVETLAGFEFEQAVDAIGVVDLGWRVD